MKDLGLRKIKMGRISIGLTICLVYCLIRLHGWKPCILKGGVRGWQIYRDGATRQGDWKHALYSIFK